MRVVISAGVRSGGCEPHQVGAGLERRLRCSGGGDVPAPDECAVGKLCKVALPFAWNGCFPILKGRKAHFVGIYKEQAFTFLCEQHQRPAFRRLPCEFCREKA